jgi:fructose-specific phosphotransferase system IIC component
MYLLAILAGTLVAGFLVTALKSRNKVTDEAVAAQTRTAVAVA